MDPVQLPQVSQVRIDPQPITQATFREVLSISQPDQLFRFQVDRDQRIVATTRSSILLIDPRDPTRLIQEISTKEIGGCSSQIGRAACIEDGTRLLLVSSLLPAKVALYQLGWQQRSITLIAGSQQYFPVMSGNHLISETGQRALSPTPMPNFLNLYQFPLSKDEGRLIVDPIRFDGTISTYGMSPDGGLIAAAITCDDKNIVQLKPAKEVTTTYAIDTSDLKTTCINFLSEDRVALGTDSGVILIYQRKNGEYSELVRAQVAATAIRSINQFGGSDQLIVGDSRGQVLLTTPGSSNEESQLIHQFAEPSAEHNQKSVYTFEIASSGRYVVASSNCGELVVLEKNN